MVAIRADALGGRRAARARRRRRSGLDAPWAIAHDLCSLVEGVDFATREMAQRRSRGEAAPEALVEAADAATTLLVDVLSFLAAGSAPSRASHDLWSVARAAAARRPEIRFPAEAPRRGPVATGSLLDVARLLGLLLDNAVEHGGGAELRDVEGALELVSGRVATDARAARGRGMGLRHAEALAARLGLRLGREEVGPSFVVTLSS